MDLPRAEIDCPSYNCNEKNMNLSWKNKFGSESNVPCGLISYENPRSHVETSGLIGDNGNGASAQQDKQDSTDRNALVPIPVAVRSVDVIGVAVDCGLDLTVFQVYENRGNSEKEMYYILPLDESMGLYRFEFRSYCLAYNTGPRSRDGEAFKVLTVRSKGDFLNKSLDHQHDSFDFRRNHFLKVYIGVIQPMDVIQIKFAFVQEIPAAHNFFKSGDFVMQLQIPSILFPNYGLCLEDLNSGKRDEMKEPLWLSNKNQSYAVYEEYPVRFIFRVFQLFACEFQPIPNIMTFTVKDTRGLKMTKENDIWHPYQIDGLSTKTEMLNGLQILLSPTFELKHEARLIVESHEGCIASLLSYCINLEPRTDSDVIFLLDQSGSMIGKPMNLAKSVLMEMLKSLPLDIRFNVVGFGSNYELFFKQPKTADRETIEQALSFVESSDATLGCSNLANVLNAIISSSTVRKSVIIISDGQIEDFDKVGDLMRQFQDQVRVFAVLPGSFNYSGVKILKKITSATTGICQLVLSDWDIRKCVKSVIPNLTQPAFRTERVDWSSQVDLDMYCSTAPFLICDARKIGITYGGAQKTFCALFAEKETGTRRVNTDSLKASVYFTGVPHLENVNAESYESPASYITGTGATLLFHRLSALQLIKSAEEQTVDVDSNNDTDSSATAAITLKKAKEFSECLNLMTSSSTMSFFKNGKSVTDAWAQDTRYAFKDESHNGSPRAKCDTNAGSSKSKRSSRVTAAMPSIKELYAGDYSISCLRDLMIGRNVFMDLSLQTVDGSFDLTKEFSANLKIDFTYLSQARHRYVSKHSWATMMAFTILTNKLGSWNGSQEKIEQTIEKSSQWLKFHMTEFEISCCLHSALKVLWTYFQNEASLQTVEMSRKRQSYTRFYR